MVEQLPWLTVLPPVLAIILAIATRRVLLSLGVGVLLAAVLIADFAPGQSITLVWGAFAEIFYADGAIATGSVFILVFLLLLGIITSVVLMSGGTEAFSLWAVRRINTRRGAKLFAAVLGVAIFIDDYFNALAVGQVAKPLTDRYRISRAKLAYIIDSTSAPVSIVAPFSSWGASIIGLIAPVVITAGVATNGVTGFLWAAAANFYAIAAVLAVFLAIYLPLELGPMRREETRALRSGHTYAKDAVIPGELSEELPVHRPGAMNSLIVPFVLLVLGVIGGMLLTGYQASGSLHLMDILGATSVAHSLLYGAVLGLAAALWYYLRAAAVNPQLQGRALARGASEGIKSMLPAIYILVLAWMLGSLVAELGTGDYLGQLLTSAGIAPAWLIPVIFVVAGFMAFSTGTSWGSFGLLIPLAGEILLAVDAPEIVLPALGAVLAGAVMGDHCSPISDTTILSATGAGCEVLTHVNTQLPYVVVVAAASLLGYIALALGAPILLGLAITVVATCGLGVVLSRRTQPLEQRFGPDLEPAH